MLLVLVLIIEVWPVAMVYKFGPADARKRAFYLAAVVFRTLKIPICPIWLIGA